MISRDFLNSLVKKKACVFGDNFFDFNCDSSSSNQEQTNDVFSEKWSSFTLSENKEKAFEMQKSWYLSLYGFSSEAELAAFLQTKPVIYDAGCGLGYKAAWFAQLAPESIVIGMDYSDSARIAASNYADIKNLYFFKGDIAHPFFEDSSIDYTSCDQVIMHTNDPDATFTELVRSLKPSGQFACYFYAKKALPRELVDDYFRTQCSKMSSRELWEMSKQLTVLGKVLSDLNVSFNCPDVPALGIKGGTYDIQRFLYWNFLKCYWNESLGVETSDATNFDWYSPSNARRYSEEEVRDLVVGHALAIEYFHVEEACYSGRFVKNV